MSATWLVQFSAAANTVVTADRDAVITGMAVIGTGSRGVLLTEDNNQTCTALQTPTSGSVEKNSAVLAFTLGGILLQNLKFPISAGRNYILSSNGACSAVIFTEDASENSQL